MTDVVWLIPALPLFGFVVLVVAGRRLGEPAAGWFAFLMPAAAFAVTLGVWIDLLSKPAEERSVVNSLFTWIPAGSLHVDIGFLVDPLSVTMLLFVTGIGALIHLYSIGYMHGDPDFSKFFVYLNLFVFSMVMLVLGDNLLVTFLGWEGVGTCSYLLISFWFTRETAATAGKKAFITNRIGDWGFMIAMFLVFQAVGTLNYTGLLEQSSTLATSTVTAICLLLFLGAVGKSAQLPLYVWLPDAMEGPTPVSALIHAATMVTAGVYLMCRISPLLAEVPNVGTVIAIVGAATALFAATCAVAQHDIKKVLAYSTVSQLGLHVPGRRIGRLRGRRVPHDHPRLLQGVAVPRRRLGDPRHARRGPGHAPHGRAPQGDADHGGVVHHRLAGHRRCAAVRRLLVEGRDPGERVGQEPAAVARRRGGGRPDRVLHEPPGVHGVLRQGPLGRGPPAPRRGWRPSPWPSAPP